MKKPVRIAVTGAAGQISYALLFRLASGGLLGPDQPVILQLLEITPALDALKGVVMELDDCAFPTLAGVEISDDPQVAFKDADYAFLVGVVHRVMEEGLECLWVAPPQFTVGPPLPLPEGQFPQAGFRLQRQIVAFCQFRSELGTAPQG